MKFTHKLATALSVLMLTGAVHAYQEQLCPELSAIKAEGMTMAEQLTPNYFYSYNLSNYNTSTNWGFLIAPLETKSGDIAIEMANSLLSTMTAPGVPHNWGENEYFCSYNTGTTGILAYAANADQMMSLGQLRRYIQK